MSITSATSKLQKCFDVAGSSPGNCKGEVLEHWIVSSSSCFNR
jgi:hypothetical protein